jgi:TolA-binding protein
VHFSLSVFCADGHRSHVPLRDPGDMMSSRDDDELKKTAKDLSQRNEELHEHIATQEQEIRQMKDQQRKQLEDERRKLEEEKQKRGLAETEVCLTMLSQARIGRQAGGGRAASNCAHSHTYTLTPPQPHQCAARGFANKAATAHGGENATRPKRTRARTRDTHLERTKPAPAGLGFRVLVLPNIKDCGNHSSRTPRVRVTGWN